MRRLNPGYKLLSLIIASLLLSVTFHTRLNLLVCGTSLLAAYLTPGVNRKRLSLTLIPFVLTAAGLFTAGLFFSSGGQEGVEVSALGQRTLYATYGGLGLLFAFTTNSMDLVMSLMQQFRLPPKFAYGILAAYHFFPVVREEYRIVGAALRVRGVKAGPFSTRRLFPMLAHALERSESLAMAMESRGFESRQPRAVAFRVPLRAVDFLFLIGLNGALAAGLFFL